MAHLLLFSYELPTGQTVCRNADRVDGHSIVRIVAVAVRRFCFRRAQKRHEVRIGLKVDALDALQQGERRFSKCSPLRTVGRGYGMRIGAELIFLQDQVPRQPIGVDRSDAPMSRCTRLMIRSDSPTRQDGLAARPQAARSSLDCYETHASRVLFHGNQWKIACEKPQGPWHFQG